MTTAFTTSLPPQFLLAPTRPCLYCSGSDYEPLYRNIQDRLGHVPGHWSFWRCLSCRSAILSPFPRAEDLVSYYPALYSFTPEMGEKSRFNRWLAGLEYRLFFGPQYEAQVRKVCRGVGWAGQPGLRLLDVGCGRGIRLLSFQKRGFAVEGVDFQPEVVADVREKLGLPMTCSDVDSLRERLPSDTFDLITAFCVMEHVPDVSLALRNCYHLLKPGGWLVGTIPLIDCIQGRLFRARWNEITEAPRHLSLPSQKGLVYALERVGYDDLAIRSDTLLNCAVLVGLSLFPGGLAPYLYGHGRLSALSLRCLAALATAWATPLCLVENYLLRRPPLGMFFAHKPQKATV